MTITVFFADSSTAGPTQHRPPWGSNLGTRGGWLRIWQAALIFENR